MSIKDENYLKAALETINLALRLLEHYNQIQTLGSFYDTLCQIELKAERKINANTKVSTELKGILDINLPDEDQDNKSAMYWQGVRDLTQIIIKQWVNGKQDFLTLQDFIVRIRTKLLENLPHEDNNPLEQIVGELIDTTPTIGMSSETIKLSESNKDKDPSPATPYIYNPPPPPEGKAKAIEKKKVVPEVFEISNESIQGTETNSNTYQPLEKRILEENEDEDEILSQSLKDALKILRDED